METTKNCTLVVKLTEELAVKETLARAVTPWFVYMIRTRQEALYTGITTDVVRRFNEHQAVFRGESGKGAKFFRSQEPLVVVYREQCPSRSVASRRERQIKKLSAQAKRALIDGFN